MVHQSQLVVGESAPRVIDRDWPCRLAAASVALVHSDTAEVALELIPRVDNRCRPVADARVQSAARGDQQRKAGAEILVADADVALFVEPESSSWINLLSKHLLCRGGRHSCGPRSQ